LGIEKGKPAERQGRKATGPFLKRMAAWPPINRGRKKLIGRYVKREKGFQYY